VYGTPPSAAGDRADDRRAGLAHGAVRRVDEIERHLGRLRHAELGEQVVQRAAVAVQDDALHRADALELQRRVQRQLHVVREALVHPAHDGLDLVLRAELAHALHFLGVDRVVDLVVRDGQLRMVRFCFASDVPAPPRGVGLTSVSTPLRSSIAIEVVATPLHSSR
jgi:hypothetical protein